MILMVQKNKHDWERFGRASKESAPEITELNKWRNNPVSYDEASYPYQIWIHKAHVVMLAEEEIITDSEALTIIKGLEVVKEKARSDPSLFGYMSTETALRKEIGEVGGKMHIGRSRNDLGHTQRRLYYRDQTERLIRNVTSFRESVLKKAEKNIQTVMPGYTHWRQAQPVTFAHYLLAHGEAAGRTVERLENIHNRINKSTLGSAALAGTGWMINRERTMELLGFDGLIENSYDCVASVDYFMELSAAIVIHMSNLSRLAEDFQIWSSDEYCLVDLDEAYAGTSSIMPQKKNPLILEQVKSYSAESLGAMVSIMTSMNGTSYTNIQDRVMLEPKVIDTVVGSTKVMAGVVETIIPMEVNMLDKIKNGFSTMTDLTDTLVRLYGTSFRQAHDIIVHVTLEAMQKGLKACEITPTMIEKASELVMAEKITIQREDLESSIDPSLNVYRRKVQGGPSPESVKAMILLQREQVKDEKNRQDVRKKAIQRAKIKLSQAVEQLR